MADLLRYNSAVILISGFLASLLFVWVVRKAGLKYGFVVMPRKDRWHTKPTALHGGIGMFLAFLLGTLTLKALNFEFSNQILTLIICSALMFGAGLYDDIKGLKPLTKLFLQVIPSVLMVSSGVIIHFSPFFALNLIVTVFWFIGIINATNMIDNMDGLSAGIVLIAASFLASFLLPDAQIGIPILKWLFLVIGITLGFLVFNFKPASIFMGDSGSLFLGFFIAAAAIPSELNNYWSFIDKTEHSWDLIHLFAPAILLAVPVFDTTLVTISRKWFSRKASQGGRDHSSHRLCALGLSEANAVLTLYLLAAVSSTTLYTLSQGIDKAWPFVALLALIMLLFGLFLARVDSYGSDSKQSEWAEKLEGIFRRRKFIEMILDLVLIVACYRLCFSLLNFDNQDSYGVLYVKTLPWVLLGYFGIFVLLDFYRSITPLIGIAEFSIFIKGFVYITIVTSGLFYVFILNNSSNEYSFPKLNYLPLVFNAILFLLICGSRVSYRLMEHFFNLQQMKKNQTSLAFYGAGQLGKTALGELMNNPEYRQKYFLKCFLDDDPNKNGKKLGGFTILDHLDAKQGKIDEIWITTEKIAPEKLKKQVDEKLNSFTKNPKIKKLRVDISDLES